METLLVGVAAGILKINVKEAGIIFYNVLSFPAWLAILDELVEEHSDPKIKTDWAKISKKLVSLNIARTKLAHQILDERDLSLVPSFLNLTRKAKAAKARPMGRVELSKFRSDVLVTSIAIGELFEKLIGRDKQPEKVSLPNLRLGQPHDTE